MHIDRVKYYAIPSLHAPTLVFNESALEDHLVVIGALLRGQQLKLPTAAYTPILIDNIVNAGCANHLIEPYAVSGEAIHAHALFGKFFADDSVVACLLSRSRKHNVLTKFYGDKKNVWADKYFVDSDSSIMELSDRISAVVETCQPWLSGEGLERKLELYALTGDWPSFCGLLNRFIGCVYREFNHDDSHISGLALEAIARNCIIESGNFSFFDLEYRSSKPIQKSYFILRVCYHLFGQNSFLLADSPFENYKKMYEYFCKENGVQSNLNNDLESENNFIRAVASVPRTIFVSELLSAFSLSDEKKKNKLLKKNIRIPNRLLKISFLIMIFQIFFSIIMLYK